MAINCYQVNQKEFLELVPQHFELYKPLTAEQLLDHSQVQKDVF